MRAAVYEEYGSPDVVQIREVEKPVPREGEVLVRVRATTVTVGDRRVRSLDMPEGFGLMGRLIFGFARPRKKILGTELAGDVEALGPGVSRFKVGDAVFASLGMGMGGHAEYVCVSEKSAIAHKPKNMSYEEAASVSFGGMTALSYLRDLAKVQKGSRVLVYGASGSVGNYAVQLAKFYGAEVTGVCSGKNAELVRSLGADHVIDYTREDFTKTSARFDVIFETVGKVSFQQCRPLLKKDGLFLVSVLTIRELPLMLLSLFRRQKVAGTSASEKAEDLAYLKMLIEEGKLKTVIDSTYPLERISDAHRKVDSGHKVGSAVVTMRA